MSSFHEITESLFLGPAYVIERQPQSVKDAGVTHVVSVVTRDCARHPHLFEYKHVQLEDDHEAPIRDHLHPVADHIHAVIESGKKVYVHCEAGVSRSSSMVIAYLIKHKGMSLKDAYGHTQQRRPCIAPNPGFFQALNEFEVEVHKLDESSMPWTDQWVAMIKAFVPKLGEDKIRHILERCNWDLNLASTLAFQAYEEEWDAKNST